LNLVGRKYGSPLLNKHQKLLLNFVNQPVEDYFRQNSSQAKAFAEIMTICKAGWNAETSRKKKWTAHCVAENLALLLVIRWEVEKDKEMRHAEVTNRAATWSGSAPGTGVPKATNFMRAIRKLRAAYEPSLKLNVQAQKDAENVVHGTPSLSFQLNGTRDQDHVPWGKWAKCESNCPVCKHTSTMPMQLCEAINAADALLRVGAETNGGDGKFEVTANKVGCYCFGQNCYGDDDGIGCWWCVVLARRKDDLPSVEVEKGVCQFDCHICKCNCQAIFQENKRHTIANGLEKSAKQRTKPSETRKSLNKEGCSMYFNYMKNALKNNSVRELQDVDYRFKDEQANDAITRTAINVLGNSRLQSDPYVMRGLQDLIPGRHTDVTISYGGKKVNMSLAQARKQLKKGSKKSPPKPMPISSEHTPPYSNFVSNVDNRAWRNGLSSEPMYPHQEEKNTTAAVAVTTPAALMATMAERVQKRVLDVFLNVSLNVSSPATKKIAAKVRAQLARKDPAFMSVVDRFQDVKCSQEISSACLNGSVH
jgi:hypothetical protein